ncbi:hypothetical protein OGATHE_000513 [Ogataea polymorpha]|uniref:Uncharacterized protein n=1 Tax=Ogataea polymorpha TaxID=460523 RepID=A0A9P8PUZ2_9ASCO|nr:hypothetical protein OGATHE_000513 [Ogataea polymorpha]
MLMENYRCANCNRHRAAPIEDGVDINLVGDKSNWLGLEIDDRSLDVSVMLVLRGGLIGVIKVESESKSVESE